jgi:hypothetical protein
VSWTSASVESSQRGPERFEPPRHGDRHRTEISLKNRSNDLGDEIRLAHLKLYGHRLELLLRELVAGAAEAGALLLVDMLLDQRLQNAVPSSSLIIVPPLHWGCLTFKHAVGGAVFAGPKESSPAGSRRLVVAKKPAGGVNPFPQEQFIRHRSLTDQALITNLVSDGSSLRVERCASSRRPLFGRPIRVP